MMTSFLVICAHRGQGNKNRPPFRRRTGWVRLAQRVPVRIRITDVPAGIPLVSGMTATVTIRRADARESGGWVPAERPVAFTKCPTRAARSCRFRSRALRVLRDRSRANAALVYAWHASLFPLQGPYYPPYYRMGEGLEAPPQLYSTRGPSMRFLVRQSSAPSGSRNDRDACRFQGRG